MVVSRQCESQFARSGSVSFRSGPDIRSVVLRYSYFLTMKCAGRGPESCYTEMGREEKEFHRGHYSVCHSDPSVDLREIPGFERTETLPPLLKTFAACYIFEK